GKVEFDLAQMMAHKDKVVADNVKGIDFLFRKNKVDLVKGTARIAGANAVEVAGADGKATRLAARHIVIATGSAPSTLPGLEIDEKKIVTSTGALVLPVVPKRLVVIGAGVIGLELGSVWRRLGAEVTAVEFLDRICPGMDGEIAKGLQRILEKQGIKFLLGVKVTGAKSGKSGVTLAMEPVAGGGAETLEADVVLVAVGRRPYLDGLGLEAVGVKTEKGRVVIDDHFRSSIPSIYAIGDCVRGAMLAHKAEDEGVAVAELIAGQKGHVNYDAIPGVVYTSPEVATVGKTEDELKAANVAYRVGKVPFMGNGKARATGETEGFAKVIADAKSDRLLGVHVIGAGADMMIAEAATVLEFGGSAEDLGRICHAHPTMNETIKEAALAAWKQAIHA
ncbi:MAG: dihydrolipoyl dehydrogenase, partial [Alphaproteobacteria bacterium]|nr:dihydrolipoyl dehydrogenase [Alphaproteobacteria bacterium]